MHFRGLCTWGKRGLLWHIQDRCMIWEAQDVHDLGAAQWDKFTILCHLIGCHEMSHPYNNEAICRRPDDATKRLHDPTIHF
jgi:hypothetical protein